MDQQKLQIDGLAVRHVGVSSGLALAYSEAVSVCLAKHHRSPVHYRVRDNEQEYDGFAEWEEPTQELQAAWANDTDAVEAGAYGLALAAIDLTRGLVALGRAETKTGADYYLGSAATAVDDLESAVRLEVSGVGVGSEATIKSRLSAKLAQTARGASNLPAIASVVGFACPLILSADLVDE